jgi:hypothetical protein
MAGILSQLNGGKVSRAFRTGKVNTQTSVQCHRTAAVRTCSELGIFELIPQAGKASLQELVDKTGADRQLLCEVPDPALSHRNRP